MAPALSKSPSSSSTHTSAATPSCLSFSITAATCTFWVPSVPCDLLAFHDFFIGDYSSRDCSDGCWVMACDSSESLRPTSLLPSSRLAARGCTEAPSSYPSLRMTSCYKVFSYPQTVETDSVLPCACAESLVSRGRIWFSSDC